MFPQIEDKYTLDANNLFMVITISQEEFLRE